jgi:hypothetical protein
MLAGVPRCLGQASRRAEEEWSPALAYACVAHSSPYMGVPDHLNLHAVDPEEPSVQPSPSKQTAQRCDRGVNGARRSCGVEREPTCVAPGRSQ